MKRPSLTIDLVVFILVFPALLGTLAVQSVSFILALEITLLVRFLFKSERMHYVRILSNQITPGKAVFTAITSVIVTALIGLVFVGVTEVFWELFSHIALVEDIVTKDGLYICLGVFWCALILFASKIKKNEFE